MSEPFRAVHFVYGLFYPDIPALSGRALFGSLAALGFSDEAARGILLRLRRRGFIESRRAGREAAYILKPRSIALIDAIARRSSAPPPPWDSTFETLVVHVPPTERAFREQLRRHASYAGFGSPLPGLLVAPYASSMLLLEPLLAARPGDTRITRGRLAVRPDEAAALAASAWNLEPVAAAVRAETERMWRAAETAETRPPAGSAALDLLWRAIGPFFEILSANPPLPAELLPAGWPLDAARAAFVRLAMHVAGPARQHVERLTAGTP